MRKSITGAIAASILSICVAAALAQTAPAKSADTSKGKALVDAKGMTLYTFDRDASGKSNCNGVCATNWPPLMAGADAKASGDWTIVTRDDGGKQWAYKGKPLYDFAQGYQAGRRDRRRRQQRLAHRRAVISVGVAQYQPAQKAALIAWTAFLFVLMELSRIDDRRRRRRFAPSLTIPSTQTIWRPSDQGCHPIIMKDN